LTAPTFQYIYIDILSPLKFVASSKKDLPAFPDDLKQDMGHVLFAAQQGGRAPTVKALQGFGGGSIVEIVEDHDGDTFRCVYTTKLSDPKSTLFMHDKN
jgi:phage-related protein